MKIYLLIGGADIKAYASLFRLCKENGIDKISKKDLPARSKILGSDIIILEIEVDERV